MTIQLRKFSEISHLIPEQSIYQTHYQTTDNSKIIFIDGDYHFDRPIDLDEADTFFGLKESEDYRDYPLSILVTGNVTAGNIYNGETDGSVGLIVLGNLTADNIVVGGQEIFVQGDLNVSGLYWGDYNHGDLNVLGEIYINVFLETDYGYDWERFRANDRIFIPYILLDSDEDFDDFPNRLTAVLKPEFIEDYEEALKYNDGEIWSWKNWINNEVLFPALKNGEKHLLNTPEQISENLKQTQERIPIFPDNEISLQNLLRFTYPPYFNLMSFTKDNAKRIEIWDYNDVFYRIYYEEDTNTHSVYIENMLDKNMVVYVDYEDNIFGVWIKDVKNNELLTMNPEDHPRAYAFLMEQWQRFQQRYETIVFHLLKYNDVVNKQSFYAVMNNEQIWEKYNAEKDEVGTVWIGGLALQLFKEQPEKRDRISIVENEGYDNDNNPIWQFYHYEWDDTLGRVVLLTQDGNGYEFEPYEVSFGSIWQYKKATKFFKRIKAYFEFA